MIQTLTHQENSNIEILEICFKELGIDLYQEILGDDWGFRYNRTQWYGLINDEEGKKLELDFDGAINYRKCIQEKGWKICQVNSDLTNHNLRLIFGIIRLNQEFFYIYNPSTKKISVYDLLTKNRRFQNPYINNFDIEGNEESGLLYPRYGMFYENDKTKICDENECCFDVWKKKMKLQTNTYPYYGLQGMKKLNEQIEKFSYHGHEKWMSEWSKWFIYQFKIVYKQRKGCLEYVLSKSSLNSKMLYQLENCLKCWENFMKMFGFQCDLKAISEGFSQIVICEQNIFV